MKVPTKGTNPDSSGSMEAGWTHFLIESAVEDEEQGKITVQLVARASASPGNVGKKMTEFFGSCDGQGNHSDGMTSRLLKFCCAIGLLSKSQWEAAVADGGASLTIDGSLAEGRQFCSKLVMKDYKGKTEKYKGKKFADVGFSIFAVNDPEAKDCPKDEASVKFMLPLLKSAGDSAEKQDGSRAKGKPAGDDLADL